MGKIAELFPEKVQPALMLCVRLDADAEGDVISFLYAEFGQVLRADGRFVEENAILRDQKRLDDAVLRGKIRPPFGIQPAPPSSEISGGDPRGDLRAVDPESDVAFPLVFIIRRFAADLHTQFDGIDVLVFEHIVRYSVFEIAFAEPDDLRAVAFGREKSPGQVVRDDDLVRVRHAAACFDPGVRKTADRYFHGESFCLRRMAVHVEVQRKMIDLARYEFRVAARVAFDGHVDEPRFTQDVDVEGYRRNRQFEFFCKVCDGICGRTEHRHDLAAHRRVERLYNVFELFFVRDLQMKVPDRHGFDPLMFYVHCITAPKKIQVPGEKSAAITSTFI